MAEQLGPWSLLWKVSDAGPGNPKKPLRMLGNYSKKASVISLPLGCFIKLQISSQSSRSQRRPAYLSRPRDAAARETWRVTTTWSSATPDPQCARQSGRRWYTASHGNSWEVNVLTQAAFLDVLAYLMCWVGKSARFPSIYQRNIGNSLGSARNQSDDPKHTRYSWKNVLGRSGLQELLLTYVNLRRCSWIFMSPMFWCQKPLWMVCTCPTHFQKRGIGENAIQCPLIKIADV